MIGKFASMAGLFVALCATSACAQYYPAPVTYAAPVYSTPYYAAPPVVYNPGPAVIYSQPVYAPAYAPAYGPYYGGYPYYGGPAIGIGLNFGGGHHGWH